MNRRVARPLARPASRTADLSTIHILQKEVGLSKDDAEALKPENRARYPANWPQIREDILRRALWRCEHPGCEALHHDVGYWLRDRFWPMPRALRDIGHKAGDLVACSDGSTIKLIKIVLTIAHLDHTPENCDPGNLRAWCQRHHLAYDQEHHKQTAYATRKANANTRELFA